MNTEPSRWLVDHAHLLPPDGYALDVACGTGRHALWLSAHGFVTRAVDRDRAAIEHLRESAQQRQLAIDAQVVNLEDGTASLPAHAFDVIVVVSYLHRPLFPELREALRPGGILVYETFTRDQARRGKPTNPAFLLEPGELRRLIDPLDVLAEREGDFDGKMVASVIAKRS